MYDVRVQRTLSINSTLNLSHGKEVASWQQTLSYSNFGNFSDSGNVEINTQQTTGNDSSSSGYAKQFSYPLDVLSVYGTIADNISYIANISYGKDIQTVGQPVFPTGLESFAEAGEVHPHYSSFQGASLSTTFSGNATYLANLTSSTSFSYGTSEQDMVFSGLSVTDAYGTRGFPTISGIRELFHRHVAASNGTVTDDEETLIEEAISHTHGRPVYGGEFASSDVPGRGGGRFSSAIGV